MRNKVRMVRLGMAMLLVGLMVVSPRTSMQAAYEKPVELTVFIGSNGQAPTPNNKISGLLREKLGIALKYEFLVGDLDQKVGLMIAGGDYPDLMTGNTRLIDAGAFIPLEGLIQKHAPRLYAHFKPYWNKIKEPKDGHIYVLPNYGRYYGTYKPTTFYGPCFWMQKAILAEFGYPKVRTLDQYFDLLVKYKKKYPNIAGKPTIGFTILSEGWRDFCLKNPPQHLMGHPNDGGVVVNQKTFKAQIFADKDYAKRYYQKLNQMNDLGLIDRESFVMTYDQYIAKLSSGNVLGMFDQRWNYGNADLSLKTRGMVERTYAPCPVTYNEKIRDWYMDRTVLNLNCGFGITKKCKDPVKVIKFLDALLTEEWQKILGWGIAGEDYKVDAQGVFYCTPEQRVHGNDPMWILANKENTFWGYAPKMEGTYADGNACTPGYQPGEFFDALKPYEQEFLTKYNNRTWADFYSPAPENPIYYPAWQINLIDGSPAKVAETKMGELARRYLPKVILAKPAEFNKVWSEYVRALHKVDIKAYEKRINEQIAWRVKNWTTK